MSIHMWQLTNLQPCCSTAHDPEAHRPCNVPDGLETLMEKNIETTIMGYIGIIGYILGLYWDNGKENGNHYRLMEYIFWGYFGIMEDKMETTIQGL